MTTKEFYEMLESHVKELTIDYAQKFKRYWGRFIT